MSRAFTASEYSARTDWLNVSVLSTIFRNPLLLLFQIWYLANWIFRSLFPSTQGAVTRFNPYGFLHTQNYTIIYYCCNTNEFFFSLILFSSSVHLTVYARMCTVHLTYCHVHLLYINYMYVICWPGGLYWEKTEGTVFPNMDLQARKEQCLFFYTGLLWKGLKCQLRDRNENWC